MKSLQPLLVERSLWYYQSGLNGFANCIVIAWWIFAMSSLLVIAIALLTVSIHTLKAATTNPADSLRYE
jgi:putative ABC transport system permease protein